MTVLLVLMGLFLLVSAGALVLLGIQARRSAFYGGALLASLLGLILILVSFSIVDVEPNERLVIFNRVTGDLGEPRGPGIALVNPITTSYQHYDISRQNYTMSGLSEDQGMQGDDSVEARTSGGQFVRVDVSVVYSLDPAQINYIHTFWRVEENRLNFIRSLMRSAVRDAVGQFSVETIYQERSTVDDSITDAVIPAMEAEGFLVQEILVRNITFTPEYAQSIENAQIAEVNIREQEFRVQEAEQRAEQVKVEAQGRADARLIAAQAEAESLLLIAEALQDNPALLEYQYVQNLSDQVQVLALPANSPFIFDLNNLIDQGSNSSFSPPPPPPASESDTESEGDN